ncbi:MAG TPA: DUF4124 domain-containing protein [Steroidobacter sp.]
MLRSLLTFMLAVAGLSAAQVLADVYKYTDKNGNVLYTDKPPTLPAERLDVQSQKTDIVAVQTRQQEEMKRLQEEEARRQQAMADRASNQEAERLNAKDKAERCAQARARYDRYMNSRKLYEPLPNGERRYLTSEELDAARASAKASMDVLCQ